MADEETVRRAALALPEVTEGAHWERPSFRVGGKIFAVLRPPERRAVLKLPHDHQEMLFAARPEAFAPARWGRLVGTFVVLSAVDDEQMATLVAEAWREVAPKRLIRQQPG
jgi:hypothetical protein